MFSIDNEQRALSTYYSFFKVQTEKFPHTLPSLRSMMGQLVEEQKNQQSLSKPNEKSLESLGRRINVLKATIGLMELQRKHMKTALLKLGAIMYVRLESDRQSIVLSK